jgi:hypothetical protein
MEIFTIDRKQGDFTQVYNEPFRDRNLSLKARGFIVTLLTLGSGWDFSIRGIQSILKENESAIRSVIKELMDAGYCHRYVIKDEKKRIVCWHYAFSEYRREWPEVFDGPLPKKPVVENPLVENPHLEKPLVENRGQYNTKQIQDVTDIIPKESNNGVRFVKPTIEEVRAYCRDRGNTIDPEAFVAYYESKGWKVGTAPMRDWKAAVITWERRRKESNNGNKSSSRLHLGEMEYESSTL